MQLQVHSKLHCKRQQQQQQVLLL